MARLSAYVVVVALAAGCANPDGPFVWPDSGPPPMPPECGNGVAEPGEYCDDGNDDDFDDCASDCQFHGLLDVRWRQPVGETEGLGVTGSGDVIVGSSVDPDGTRVNRLHRFARAGDEVWVRTIGPSGLALAAVAVRVDGIVVAGGTIGGATLWLGMYDADGQEVWARAIKSARPRTAVDVAISGGWAAVVGTGPNQDGRTIAQVRVLNEAGGGDWTATFTPLTNVADVAVAVLPDGRVALGGKTQSIGGFSNSEPWVRLYATPGVENWAFDLSTPGAEDGFTDIVADGAGDIVSLGQVGNSSGALRAHAASDGMELWAEGFGPGRYELYVGSVAFGGNYFAATGRASGGGWISLHDSAGVAVSESVETVSGAETFFDVAVDDAGFVYATTAQEVFAFWP